MKKIGLIVLIIFLLVFIILNFLNGFGVVNGKVNITHTSKTLWQIDYKFDQPVIGIMTGPETKEYHETSWELPEGFHFVKDESGYSWLEKKNKGSFKELTVNVSTYDRIVLYAPQPFANFNFGVSINTGPLGFATKVKLLGLFEMMHGFNLKYSFIGLESEYVLVPNSEKTTDVLIKDSGYFVYFGDKEYIVETETVQLILDTDFPVELRDVILPNVEKFITFYDKELGEVLEHKLMVQITYTDEPRAGGETFSIGGGAQSGQFCGVAAGPIDSTEIEKLTRRIRAFLAHEMGHIWQSNLGSDNMRWVNEGGAEILSHLGMKRLGMLTEVEFNTFLNKYLAESIEDLKQTSLETPHRNGFEKLNYSGGTIVLWAACKATEGDGKADDIYKMTREINKFSQDSLQRYPKECLNYVFNSLGVKENVIKEINDFIITKHESPQKAFKELFEVTGLQYETFGDSLVIK